MVDFDKAAINALEGNSISVISGCFLRLSQNVYRLIQSKASQLTNWRMKISQFEWKC